MIQSSASLDYRMNDFALNGWSVAADFLPQETVAQLASETLRFRQNSSLRPAGIGKGQERTVNAGIRGDFILWLEQPGLTGAQRDYLARLEELRMATNASLQLGLFEFEGHLAVYPPGAFYHKHIDRFQNDSQRVLSCILYLNADWNEADGGQLRLYLDDDNHIDVLPRAGTLVTFLSEHSWHEVLLATRERMSVSGWFKSRGESLL